MVGVSCFLFEFLVYRISDLMGEKANMTLLDLFANRRCFMSERSRLSDETQERLDGWLADVFVHFAFLWEASRCDGRWDEIGHIRLGVLAGPKGKVRRISGAFKRAVVLETRNAQGQGLRTVRQLLVGLAVAQKKGPAVRLGLRQRQALKKAKRTTALEQGLVPQILGPNPSNGSKFELFEQYNYHYDCRMEQ